MMSFNVALGCAALLQVQTYLVARQNISYETFEQAKKWEKWTAELTRVGTLVSYLFAQKELSHQKNPTVQVLGYLFVIGFPSFEGRIGRLVSNFFYPDAPLPLDGNQDDTIKPKLSWEAPKSTQILRQQYLRQFVSSIAFAILSSQKTLFAACAAFSLITYVQSFRWAWVKTEFTSNGGIEGFPSDVKMNFYSLYDRHKKTYPEGTEGGYSFHPLYRLALSLVTSNRWNENRGWFSTQWELTVSKELNEELDKLSPVIQTLDKSGKLWFKDSWNDVVVKPAS